MSFRERTAWISLVAHGLVFGGYFYVLWQSWAPQSGFGLGVELMIGAVVALVVITIALTALAAALAPKEASAVADEREQLINLKAEHLASLALSVCVVLLIGALLAGWSGVLVANLLLAAMVVSELVKAGAQIVHFRAGA